MMEMKKNFRKITSLVVALAVMVTAVVFDVPETVAAEAALSTSAAGGCDGTHTGMTEWTSTDSLPKSGNYYLATDVSLSINSSVSGTLTLCLNGHTIKYAGDQQAGGRIFVIEETGTLNLCDCQNNKGTLTDGNASDHGGAVYIAVGGIFNMYGGTISGNKTTNFGGGVFLAQDSGSRVATFTMYGGIISENEAQSGGGVRSTGKFTMTGGTITKNQVTQDGGGVYIYNGTFDINGPANISDNTAKGYGGGVCIRQGGTKNAIITMSDGIISGNQARNGGGVYVYSTYSIFTMSGGTILSNTANGTGGTDGGGGVFLYGGKFKMTAGTISGNQASGNGGGVWMYSSYSDTLFTIDGKVDISGNNNGDSANNVALNTNKIITIGENFDKSNSISVNTKKAPTCPSPVAITSETDPEISSCFKSENKDYSVVYNDNAVKLAVSHDPQKIDKKDATCDEDGNEEYWYCPNCDKNYSSSECTTEITPTVITKTGHTPTYIEANDPTCTEDGNVEYWHCSTCKKYFSDENCATEITEDDTVDPATGHTYGAWSIKTDPTTTATGTAERVCSNNNEHKEIETLPVLTDSTWEKTETTKPTIDTDGSYTYTSGYGTVTATVPKLTDTVWTKNETTKPTINTDGSYTYTSDYGTVTATVPKLSDASVWTKDEAKSEAATEDKAGKDVYTSVLYGEVIVTIPTLGHTHDLTYVPEVPATETAEGVKEHWHCEGCKKNFADENGTTELTDLTIPTLTHTHTLTYVPEVPATETTEGTKEHWHCEGCGKDFVDENGENEVTNDELKIGKIEKEVQTGENAPETKLETPLDTLIEAVLTSEEQGSVRDGSDVKIILTVEDATESVSSEDKTAVESKIESLTDYHLGQYLDVNLLKIIDGETKKIAETSAPITITFEIPAGLRVSGRSYSVIRVHDGETTVLPDLDNDENTVTIQSDQFSTYVLVYVEANASNPGGGNPGGSSSTPTTPTPGGNHSGTTPSGSNSNNGNSGTASGNDSSNGDNSSAEGSNSPVSGNNPSDDRNDDSDEVEDDFSDVEDDEDDSEDIDDDSADVDEDFSDDDDDFSDVTDDSSEESGSNDENSDRAENASSEDTAFSVDGEGHVSGESDGNPETGVAVSFAPLAAAAAVLMAARRKKK